MFDLAKRSGFESSSKRLQKSKRPSKRIDKTLSHPAFKALIAVNIVGAVVAGWLYFNRQQPTVVGEDEPVVSNSFQAPQEISARTSVISKNQSPDELRSTPREAAADKAVVTQQQAVAKQQPGPVATRINEQPEPVAAAAQEPARKEPATSAISETISYTVAGPQVYFHNKPDERTRRNAFINRWNKAVLKPLDEENGFVYIVYTNAWGQTSKGWMKKSQLKPLNHVN